jgi:hypothetical protein
MATELRVVSIHEIPGRAEETATVEVLRGSLNKLKCPIFGDSESDGKWRLGQVATAPANSSRFLIGLTKVAGGARLRPGMQLIEEDVSRED